MFVLNDTTGIVLFPNKLEHFYKAICNLDDIPVSEKDTGNLDDYILSIIGTTHKYYPDDDIKILCLQKDANKIYIKYNSNLDDPRGSILYSDKYKTCIVLQCYISKEIAKKYNFEHIDNIIITSDYTSIHNSYFENVDRLKETIKSIEYIINIKNERIHFINEIKNYIKQFYAITENKNDRVKKEYFNKNMNDNFKNRNKIILREIINELACEDDELYYYGFKELVDLKCYNEFEVELYSLPFESKSINSTKQIKFSEDCLSGDPSDLEKLITEWHSKDLTKVNKLPVYKIDDSLKMLYPTDQVSTISSNKLPSILLLQGGVDPWVQGGFIPSISARTATQVQLIRNSLQ